jgi:hypothetical protein
MADKPTHEIYLEIGQKRTFAAALDWPGWSRSGRDEAAALQALLDYGQRYAQALAPSGLGFLPAAGLSAFRVVERAAGNAATDFGAPGAILPRDGLPVEPGEPERWEKILKACWGAFDAARQAAAGKELRTGPRGGGRDLEKIVRHVVEAEAAYLSRLGGKVKLSGVEPPELALPAVRQEILDTLGAAVRGEVAARGPRGGLRWTPRYFVRMAAWHALDHAWEIEDRTRPA